MEQESPAYKKQTLGSLLCLHSNPGSFEMRMMKNLFPRCTSDVVAQRQQGRLQLAAIKQMHLPSGEIKLYYNLPI